jgi:hypothetical protein
MFNGAKTSPSEFFRNRGKSKYRSIFILIVAIAAFVAPVRAQTAVPATVVLSPGFVGGKYEVPLDEFLPTGTTPLNWALVADGTAADGTNLKTPTGVTVDNVNKKLVVAPTVAALVNPAQPKEYVFEVQGTNAALNLTIRFNLRVRPFGVDESRISSLGGPVTKFSPEHGQSPPPPPPSPFVLATSTADEETIVLDRELDNDAQPPVAGPDYSTLNQARILDLINRTVGAKQKVTEVTQVAGITTNAEATNFRAGDYLLVHVIVWKPVEGGGKADAQRQLWGLYKAKDKDIAKTEVEWEPQPDLADKNLFSSRVFGGKRVAVLLINFTTPTNWDVKYSVALNQRIPTPIQNLITLASNTLLAGGPEATVPTRNIWGARMMLVRYTASDMVVKVNTITNNQSEVEQAKDFSKTYLNEGRYHWDVSIGLPVRSYRELQFKTDANNRVTTEAKDRQSAYGFLNIFPKAVDLSSESFLTLPHFVFGVPLASKPLHRPFAGIGYGVYKTPVKFNIFAGVVFNRERVPRTFNVGNSATSDQLNSDLQTRWVRKFMFGINFPLSQIKNALKGK